MFVIVLCLICNVIFDRLYDLKYIKKLLRIWELYIIGHRWIRECLHSPINPWKNPVMNEVNWNILLASGIKIKWDSDYANHIIDTEKPLK